MTKEFGFSGAIVKLNKISSNAKSINSIVEKEAEEKVEKTVETTEE